MSKTTVKLDAATRAAITEAVGAAIANNVPQERWLSAKQLREQYGMVTNDFLRRHGSELPHAYIQIPGGKKTQIAYQQSAIEKMLVRSTPTGPVQ